MIAEFVNAETLELVPESRLEDAVLNQNRVWMGQVRDSEPFEINVRRMVLTPFVEVPEHAVKTRKLTRGHRKQHRD